MTLAGLAADALHQPPTPQLLVGRRPWLIVQNPQGTAHENGADGGILNIIPKVRAENRNVVGFGIGLFCPI